MSRNFVHGEAPASSACLRRMLRHLVAALCERWSLLSGKQPTLAERRCKLRAVSRLSELEALRAGDGAAPLAFCQSLTRCTALERTYPPNVKVPNADKAEVQEPKIRSYLLDLAHPAGGSKARFFHQFGFANAPWEQMALWLLQHVQNHAVAEVRQKEHGTSYTVDGPMEAPDGSRLQVRSVWFIETGGQTPRFVTAHPLPKT